MSEQIKMPQLGESVTEGTITKWLVQPGDRVDKYDPIADVTTDKVNAEVPSSFAGVIQELVAEEDETVQVGELICYIDTGEKREDSQNDDKQETAGETDQKEPEPKEEQSMKTRYSPAVMRLAQENDIDLTRLQGSGRGGRITRKDVENHIASAPAPEPEPKTEEPKEDPARYPTYRTKPPEEMEALSEDKEIPLTQMRKAIASNMVKSKEEIPHAWTMVEVDVSNIVAYRDRIKDEFKEKEGFSLTFMPFFMKAIVETLKEFPEVNSVWGGDKIIHKKDINISIAVAAEDSLYVPVIKNADEKSIKGLGKEVYSLAKKARLGQLKEDEMQGGTFTINNTGSFGSVQSMPIVNHPQAAILSIESIIKKPVVVQDDMVAIRSMVNLCLSLDHRILDGLICGRFLARIKEKLEAFQLDREHIY
ncbi:dihydrolipoamide acetyltransferase family protein [Salibacterium halotolerans]|uniref:Dihydrolipoamide acetyltransferase component of pyruvate dehydrogenase complex n=1 Tax=Salibacterium halotolerans TaxID=1884432 RepID=A0A1I5NQU7_9BACI|nr:dihydrolipoamide acetyltransferase family protein [Salibacterium halotolerans]SFP24154.1 2-oxoisovalerate dehydrogenase E2 component (dihydrolipoyl transacylase) [Salibacterium halotolerans]